MLIFKGIQKTSLVDFPGEVACTFFLPKCNFRCPYCYNSLLVLEKDTGVNIGEEEALDFLDERKGFLTGVCLTGGEPSLHPGLLSFCAKLKKKGLLVKLDTNGSNPEMLEQLFAKKLVDYISMDIKAGPENYGPVTGVKNPDIDSVKKSVEIIRNSGIKYEFRTTVLPKFIGKEDILAIGKWLNGSSLYFLQQFHPMPGMIDSTLLNAAKYPKKELEAFALLLKPFFERVEVRNV